MARPSKTRAPSEPAAAPHETLYSTPTDCELVITRTFDAPRAIVWAAFTDPKHLPNWHTGPDGFTMPVCEIDLRPGGRWRYVWRNRTGREFEVAGTYREVDPPRRLVTVTHANGEEQSNTTTFAEANGRTTVTVTQTFANQASRDRGLPYAKVGTESNHARLDAYLASMS
ncbi:MAG TPA: SRPBCC domain-containing protein [Gemmatimonadaceae bacterium]|nr:SRPBCC domain-containing protein [Gemmatimonadaceae bacterium]